MIEKNNLISVVMPIYNAGKYLDKAIESILNQTYKNFEFIIINDGSTDNSLEIVESYNDERIVIISRENKGLIYSLNEGIHRAKGKYIARMDGDDISLPERFEQQVRLMEVDDLDICGCHYFMINERDDYIDSAIVPLNSESFVNFLCITTPFAHPSVMIRKEFMLNKNLFYGGKKYKNAEDYALWIEFVDNGAKFGNVNNFLFKYRDFSESLSKKNNNSIAKEKKEISRNFIIKNKEVIFNNLKDKNINTLSNREKEFIVLLLLVLLRQSFSLKYFMIIKKIQKGLIVCGLLKYIKDAF